MAKWYGKIGFLAEPGDDQDTCIPEYIERPYYGDLLRNTRRLQEADKVNDDISVSNELSIVADPFATQNFHRMRYAEFMGAKWKITSVDVQYPRLILTMGDLYHA